MIARADLRGLGGAAAVIGGVIWTAFFIWYAVSNVSFADSFSSLWPLIPAVVFLGISFIALASYEQARVSRVGLYIGTAGLGLITIGLFGMVALGIGVAWLSGIFGEMALSLGLLLFGLANLQERLLPHFNVLPLFLVIIYVPSWMIDPGSLPTTIPPNITEWLAALTGLGWILLGTLMLGEKEEITPNTV